MTPEERNFWVQRMGARTEWWALGQEAILDPQRDLVDAHFHLWPKGSFPDPQGGDDRIPTSQYLTSEFLNDTQNGHKITDCVYIECGSGRYINGPEYLRPLGETVFAGAKAIQLETLPDAPNLAAIVAYADLRDPQFAVALTAHGLNGERRFRGIRQSAARFEDPSDRLIAGAAPAGLYSDPDFCRGLMQLGERGLSFDAFQFHFQLEELVDLARATPGTTIIINHLGAPVGFTPNPTRNDPVFAVWANSIDKLADLPNVVMKLGGVASIVTKYDGYQRETPPGSEQFVTERGAYFHHAIRRFGTGRCMFGSNFPVDSISISYSTLWNAFKIIADEYGTSGSQALLADTARRIYRIR